MRGCKCDMQQGCEILQPVPNPNDLPKTLQNHEAMTTKGARSTLVVRRSILELFLNRGDLFQDDSVRLASFHEPLVYAALGRLGYVRLVREPGQRDDPTAIPTAFEFNLPDGMRCTNTVL